MSTTPKLGFNLQDAERAARQWNFNCGPAAICAVLGLTPEEVRLHLGDFEKKCYTNPTLMTDSLTRLGASHKLVFRSDKPDSTLNLPEHGVLRVQWSGPWTKPGVPMRARYRHTHWVAAHAPHVFDVNAMSVGGWMPFQEWATQLVPWLIKECCPKGDGGWWITHVLEVSKT